MSDWVYDQRVAWRSDRLSKERTEKLETLGLMWDHTQTDWDRRFRELEEFHDEYGHCFVPQRCAPLFRPLSYHRHREAPSWPLMRSSSRLRHEAREAASRMANRAIVRGYNPPAPPEES